MISRNKNARYIPNSTAPRPIILCIYSTVKITGLLVPLLSTETVSVYVPRVRLKTGWHPPLPVIEPSQAASGKRKLMVSFGAP